MIEVISALGWPHFAFIFCLIFILVFKSQLENLLSRVTSINKDGIGALPAPEAQREDKNGTEAAHELMLAIGNSAVLEDIEGRIRADLSARSLSTNGESEKVLIKYLAAATASLEFEQIHSLIFGSQIFLLKKLNEVVGQGKPTTFVDEHFDHTKELFSDSLSQWTKDQYLHFLYARSLILLNEGTYHITDMGVEYLVWMARNGRTENKAL